MANKPLCHKCNQHFTTGYVEQGKPICERCWAKSAKDK